MTDPDRASSSDPTPAWALRQATDELYDVQDTEAIAQRAREIARESQELEDERHEEYYDPDLGGEA